MHCAFGHVDDYAKDQGLGRGQHDSFNLHSTQPCVPDEPPTITPRQCKSPEARKDVVQHIIIKDARREDDYQ